jgi:2',3'-cyclic-nucleotide 2'-phosphodiesterase (5'-nucleotidase family)
MNYSKEAARLKADGINIIIALGHSGIERDKQIAFECPDIDLVIGGHCKWKQFIG